MPPLSEATRPLMWNVSHTWVMYVLSVSALAVFAWGMYSRILFWRRGGGDRERFADWMRRLRVLLGEVFLQRGVRCATIPGIFHGLMFYSFAVLFLTTAVIMIQYDMGSLFGPGFNVFRGYGYVFWSMASEAAGIFILVGIAMAAWRRYVLRPETLADTPGDGLALLFLAGIVVTGYLVEGLRMAASPDPWGMLSPVGYGIGKLLGGTATSAKTVAHASLWWTHTVLALGWIALIPFTKFVHLLSLPANVFFSKLGPRGALKRQDLEKLMEGPESELKIGIQTPADFTWKQRLDLDTCISCGRCEEICPARQAHEDQFTPRQFVALLKRSLYDSEGRPPEQMKDVVGSAFDEDFIWHCRTCTACMEVCPGLLEHVDTLMELRRNEVLIQGRMPADAARTLKMLEVHKNPFGPQSERVDWIEQMNLRVVGPGEKVDVLYWIGCCATFDPQKRKIATDLCKLLKICGIDFGVLGADEKCCGDPARVIGQEMLFQEMAKEQVALLKQREFQVLMTSCPHCYNVLAHEYRQFGADFEVAHHSEFLHEMLWLGKLKPRFGEERKCVYHDPCYLGRYQRIYESPREVIKAVPGAQLLEMKSHREKSLCCGAGGGHYWMDLKKGERINNLRLKEACDAGADTIVTGCAYCLHMLEDSVKLLNHDDTMRVVDLGSLMLESVEAPSGAKVSSDSLRPRWTAEP